MAVHPIPLEPQEPEGSDSSSGQDFQRAVLSQAECRALRALFELLQEWDRQRAE